MVEWPEWWTRASRAVIVAKHKHGNNNHHKRLAFWVPLLTILLRVPASWPAAASAPLRSTAVEVWSRLWHTARTLPVWLQ